MSELSVIIEADGEDLWIDRDGWSDYRSRSREALIERIHQFGVAGLGGAGFPTGAKLHGGGDKIETLIINAAECEPYITADDRLMQDCAAQVVEGIRILAHILQPREVLIGIEDNKPQAISMLRAVLADSHDIALRVIPTKYPSGGAKQLTQILTGKQVPHGGRSSDIGVLMQNVGTAYAVKRAVIDGEPLTERVVTLTGESVSRPGNVWARLGTPVHHLLEQAGFCPGSEQMVIMGGPLMGFTLPWLDVPVVKITNCLLAPSPTEMGETQEEKGCIRCSACADACPADLLPQQLYWYSKGQLHDKAQAHNLADCIECGACAWVCPSNIPLVQYFRQEKAEIYAISMEEKRAAEAKARFEARQARLEREKQARQERHKQAAVQPAAKDQDAINAALARVREKNATAAQPVAIVSGQKPTIAKRLPPAKRVKPKRAHVRRRRHKTPNRKPTQTRVKRRWKRLSPGQKPVKPVNRQWWLNRKRPIRARRPLKPLSPAPKHVKRHSFSLPKRVKRLSTHVKPPLKRPSPVPKHEKRHSRTNGLRPPTTIHAKPQSPPRLRVFRQRKPRSKPLTRIKWFSELQVPLTPITSARHRVL